MAITMEGPLSKWTNVVKGWQYRWFVLDETVGLLSYYTVRLIKLDLFHALVLNDFASCSNVFCNLAIKFPCCVL